MHDNMITWISSYAKAQGYKPGSSFMTSKPGAGINHKEYGVTSRGINICMEEVLKYLDIDPYKDTFTIKMSGGPDGDVAGNEMNNLYRLYPKTASFWQRLTFQGRSTIRKASTCAAIHGCSKKENRSASIPRRSFQKEDFSSTRAPKKRNPPMRSSPSAPEKGRRPRRKLALRQRDEPYFAPQRP